MTLTIFTPTYNRGYIINKLYESLCEQTDKDFVWLLVDDGSTDNTKDLVDNWIQEGIIDIQYYIQENVGKSSAHNLGVQKTNTELFCCVDSDDIVTKDSVAEIKKYASKYSKEIGLVFKRGFDKNRSITTWNQELIKASLFEAEKNYGLKGDTMLVFKTSIVKKYSFPIFENEKFVPENYLYDCLAKEGDLVFINKILYICEYLPDGYTTNMRKVIATNPKGYRAYIEKRIPMNKSYSQKWKDSIRYVAIQFVINWKGIIKNSPDKLFTFLALPFGYIFYKKYYHKYLKR